MCGVMADMQIISKIMKTLMPKISEILEEKEENYRTTKFHIDLRKQVTTNILGDEEESPLAKFIRHKVEQAKKQMAKKKAAQAHDKKAGPKKSAAKKSAAKKAAKKSTAKPAAKKTAKRR